MGKPYLPNLQPLIEAGIDPKTGLPIKFVQGQASELKNTVKQALRIMDEQAFIRRYTWKNLPDTLDGTLLERIMYYRGQGMFFYMEQDNSFYFLPFALDGTIDVYGRYTEVTPLPFNGKAGSKDDKPWIIGLKRKPQYDIKYDELKPEDTVSKCVILRDYSQQISQHVLPRCNLQEGIIDFESDILPFMRTALMAGTGISGMRVDGADQASSVKDAARAIYDAALKGEYWIPIEDATLHLEELTKGTTTNPQDYLLSLQSVDNLRLSMHGLDNGGLFEKKQHITNAELEMNASPISLIYQDGLILRQQFCDIVNSLWGLGIECVASETVLGMDSNNDGKIEDNSTQTDERRNENNGGDDNDTNV